MDADWGQDDGCFIARFSQGGRWNTVIRPYIQVMLPIANPARLAEQSRLAGSGSIRPQSNAMIAKVGAAASESRPVSAADTLPLFSRWHRSANHVTARVRHVVHEGCLPLRAASFRSTFVYDGRIGRIMYGHRDG